MVLPKDLTPEMLLCKPALLLHMQDFEGPLASTDGLAGAILSDGHHIVTSPNCTKIWDPPLGGDRHLFLRENLRYGDDDPLQWPQPHVARYRHIAFIPHRPASTLDPKCIMWAIPHHADFATEDGVLSGVGKLRHRTFLELQFLSLALINRARSSKFSKQELVSQLTDILENLLHRLEFILTSFFTMCRGIRELQRVYLELTALLDFEEHYHSQSRSSDKVNDKLMGAFTHDPTVCDELYRAGIPVWLIRPYHELHSIRIKSLKPLIKPMDFFPLKASSRPVYPSIYRGPGDVLEKYVALGRSMLDYLKYPNPFAFVRSLPLATPLPVAAPSKREIRNQRYTPYSNRPPKKGNTPSNGQDKFWDPASPILPPAIPSWRCALETFDVTKAQFMYEEVNPTDLGYVFPEPAMFIRTQSPGRQLTYFKTWLKYRTPLIFRVSSNNFTAKPMPTAVWRDILSYEHARDKMESSSTQSKDTKSSRLQTEAFNFLQNCIGIDDVMLLGLEGGKVEWNGMAVQTPSDAEREEILWELSELNFRFELLALHSRATTSSDKDPQELISACFPGCHSRCLLIADLGAANHGLADGNWEDKALYLHALKRLMMTWRGEIPSIIKMEKFQWLERDIHDLENEVAQFYVKSFYNYFRRAPIVPRGLSHMASLYRVPDPPKVTVLDPHPDKFYDTSVLALI